MTQSFKNAQQAANVAYAMTLDATGDMAQAADSYKSVMSAYMAQAYPTKRQYIDSDRDVTPLKTMADKTVNAYKNWQAFIDKCNSIDGYGMMGDRD